jgi:thiamine pyrophosphate-dependent acetolactate synthase large subunit-like protein
VGHQTSIRLSWYTGELGVCLATSGPGAIYLLNGLYDAKMDHQPVLAIVGQAALVGAGALGASDCFNSLTLSQGSMYLTPTKLAVA